MTRTELRATLVVLVLAAVGVIALWPRGADDAATAPPETPAASAPDAAAPDPAALATARASAALQPCPAPAPGAPVAALAGAPAECLGAPGTVDLATALAGRTTLVNLWASWCGPCREELPALRDYANSPDAAAVLGVDVQDDPTAALALLDALDVRYPSVSDPDRTLARRLGAAPVLPASVLVRSDGTVVPLPPEVFRSPEQVRAAVEGANGGPAR